MERQVPLGGMVREVTLEVTWTMARSQPCEGQGVRELPGRGTSKDRGPEAGRGLVCGSSGSYVLREEWGHLSSCGVGQGTLALRNPNSRTTFHS